MTKKILGISTIRSDYDLMSGLYQKLHQTPSVEFKLIVAGTHLSKTYGHSIDLIRADGIEILASYETLLDSDSNRSQLKSASILFQNMIDCVASYQPDLLIYAGDREDIILTSIVGHYLGIPTVHFFGGDHGEDGHVDHLIRHATSKLSTAHVVSTQQHKERLIALGEESKRIFPLGSVALDKFVQHQALSLEECQRRIGVELQTQKFGLVIFHPIPEEQAHAHHYLENIIQTLRKHQLEAFVSYPNTDPGNKQLISVLQKYEKTPGVHIYKNLERELFVSLYKHAQLIIGNSSSGLLEAASIPIPAVNVGLRQRGRYAGKNVLFCSGETSAIQDSIQKALSLDFLEEVRTMQNPYGDGASIQKAYDLLLSYDFRQLLPKTADPLALRMATQ